MKILDFLSPPFPSSEPSSSFVHCLHFALRGHLKSFLHESETQTSKRSDRILLCQIS